VSNEDLIELVHRDLAKRKFSRRRVEAMVREIFSFISGKLEHQGHFSINHMGRWSVQSRKSRTGHHPQLQVPIEIPASKTVKFKAADRLLKKIK